MSQFEELQAWVEARSTPDEVGGWCLTWNGSKAHGKEPQGRYKGKIILVRRELWKAKTGEELSLGVSVRCKCGEDGCVSHRCLIVTPRCEKGRVFTMAHRVAISKAVRKSPKAKLTPEAVADIRNGGEPREVYAKRYGIYLTYVSEIRNRAKWMEHEANPFSGLMR
jgi:hypothetical protein